MFLPKLYARSNTGAVLEWTVEVEDDGYRVISGQEGSPNQVTSEWRKCCPKNVGKTNATTAAEQALSEAQSKWDKKLKSKGYFVNRNDIDNDLGFVEPMLARKYGEVEFVFPVYSQPKLDGMRCIAKKDGLWSRGGKKIISVPHIFNALKPLFSINSCYIFDGEIFCEKYKNDFNQIISLAKKTKPTQEDLDLSENYLQYWIYDFPSDKNVFSKRIENLKKLIPHNKSLVVVPTDLIKNEDDLNIKYFGYLSSGQEGQMIRTDDIYENKRSNFLLKRKEFIDDEFKIIDISEGTGNRSGVFGRAHLITSTGVEFEANARGNESFYKELLQNKSKYIGKMATVRYQNLTPDGKPRFGVIVSIRDIDY